ncbi:GNAT family N-acetyltransferase [Colwellia psychrerythraea]|uniref:Acetyltransferase, GNAT family n=1 Tax=Colwellia psychrerythraea (strain 34H / ATCC BAA-681) TaxID=167879 RepID=Q47ZZ0_COLP3|nr:GNAT family N-acetyltransferase [Colwellia psychrerythraea]AAZ24310.1 acetyltransferase, GNAT family [Colwellia psychrerythraea 34H]
MYSKGNYYIYDDRNKVQFDEVKSLLKQSYWASDRDVETIQISIKNSICFSLFHNKIQVGFGRVVTDFASVAYISDVIIDSEHRSEGLGKWLVDTIVNDPRWKSKFQLLVTDDAHSLYEKFGFSSSHKLMSTKV